MQDLHALRAAEAIHRAMCLEHDIIAKTRALEALHTTDLLSVYFRCRVVEEHELAYLRDKTPENAARLDTAVERLNNRIGRMKRE